jgi:sugar phosphate isomerase/epimerase
MNKDEGRRTKADGGPRDEDAALRSRRAFIQIAAGGLAAAAGAVGRAGESGAGVVAPGRKYSICNETFQDWPQEKIFKFAAACGYRGVEVAPFTIDPDVRKITAQTRTQLRQQAEQAGVELVGLHWLLAKTEGFHLTSPDAAVRRETAAYLSQLARFCHDLGGQFMVFGSPKQRNLLPGVSREDGLKHAVEVLRSLLPTLADLGVVLALEPLSPRTTNFLTTAAEAVELAERVDSPHCRLLLDCLAMSSESTPIPELIRRHGKWLVHFHANDPNQRGPGMGKLDFVPIFQALRDVAYRGWVSVEVFDTSPGGETIARQSIAAMRKAEAAALFR